MSGFGLARMFGGTGDTHAPAPGPSVDVTVLLPDDAARDAFLAYATRHLPEGECIVEAKGLAGRRRSFTTKPSDPDAELVACAAPRLLRGRLLATSEYYRVRADRLDAQECHLEEGVPSHTYAVRLKPVVRGTASPDLPMIPA